MAAKQAKSKPKADEAEEKDEAEGKEEAAAAAAPAKKRLAGRTLVLFIILPLVLLLGGGAAAHFMGFTKALFGGSEAEEAHGDEAESATAPASSGHGAPAANSGHGAKKADAHSGGGGDKNALAGRGGVVFYNLPDMIVNLNSAGRKSNFLKLSVSLELQQQGDVSKIESVMPRIVDNFQTYLRELRVEDLRGSSGIFRLREELLTRINVAAAPTKVNDILFKEVLVQ